MPNSNRLLRPLWRAIVSFCDCMINPTVHNRLGSIDAIGPLAPHYADKICLLTRSISTSFHVRLLNPPQSAAQQDAFHRTAPSGYRLSGYRSLSWGRLELTCILHEDHYLYVHSVYCLSSKPPSNLIFELKSQLMAFSKCGLDHTSAPHASVIAMVCISTALSLEDTSCLRQRLRHKCTGGESHQLLTIDTQKKPSY
jgi:hypothetical protein